jgi:RsiW-degrading membrane proteinase PrsW (M82 family)
MAVRHPSTRVVRAPIEVRAVAALRRPWFLTLVAGLVLFVALDWATITTDNVHLVPSLLCLGAFLGPVVFVLWVYDRAREVPFPLLVACFVGGGIVGVTTAGVWEYQTIQGMRTLPTTAIGVAEETSKLLVPLGILVVAARYRREADGILVGVAAGMGFAAFETMGYGFNVLLHTNGAIGETEKVLFLRSVLSPATHAAWTGIICAALWRARAHPGPARLGAVVGAFTGAVLVHAAWDSIGSGAGLIPLAVLSFGVLAWRIEVAGRESAGTAPGPVAARAVPVP